MYLRVTFPRAQDERRFADYYHRQIWLLPILTGVFASFIWLCTAVSTGVAVVRKPHPHFILTAIIAVSALGVALMATLAIWRKPMLAVDEKLSGYIFCSSLAAAVCIIILVGPKLTVLSVGSVYACHGWLLVFLDSRLVSCLPLQCINMLVAGCLQRLCHSFSADDIVLALPLIVLGTGGPVFAKCLLEFHHRQVFMRHVQVHDVHKTIWSHLHKIINRFPQQPPQQL